MATGCDEVTTFLFDPFYYSETSQSLFLATKNSRVIVLTSFESLALFRSQPHRSCVSSELFPVKRFLHLHSHFSIFFHLPSKETRRPIIISVIVMVPLPVLSIVIIMTIAACCAIIELFDARSVLRRPFPRRAVR